MLETIDAHRGFCNNCSHDWSLGGVDRRPSGARCFRSLDDLIARTGLRRDEVVVLADLGALNWPFGYDRRSALWQVERAVRPSGALFEDTAAGAGSRRQDRPDATSPLAAAVRGLGSARPEAWDAGDAIAELTTATVRSSR